MDLMKACRCCLSEGAGMKSMHVAVLINNTPMIISHVFKFCLNIEITENDGFPQSICNLCIEQLQSVFCFKSRYENSKIIMSKYLNELHTDSQGDFFDDNSVPLLSHPDTNPSQPGNASPSAEVKSEAAIPDSALITANFFCICCDAKFDLQKDLTHHCRKKHKPANTSGPKCEYCLERFYDTTHLENHKKRHTNPFVCPWCWKAFTVSGEYEAHIDQCDKYVPPKVKRVLLEDRRNAQCQICGKSYTSDYLRVHVRLHGPNRLSCPICGKRFKVIQNYYTHMKVSHSQERPHKCPHCDLSFKLSGQRRTHIRKIHLNERKEKCDKCDKAFFSKRSLRDHVQTHTGEKNYVCEFCDKAYTSNWSLKVHLKSQHSEVLNMR